MTFLHTLCFFMTIPKDLISLTYVKEIFVLKNEKGEHWEEKADIVE